MECLTVHTLDITIKNNVDLLAMKLTSCSAYYGVYISGCAYYINHTHTHTLPYSNCLVTL